MTTKPAPSYRFGAFELDLQSGELRKNGIKLKIQEQPLQLLRMLLTQPGAVVSREEVRNQLWPADTFVDFDHSINAAIKRLREALSDEAENPRFIETLPRRGYRFIAPVSPRFDGALAARAGNKFKGPLAYAFGVLSILAVLAGGVWFYFSRDVESELPVPSVVPVTDQAANGAISPDGKEVAFNRSSELPHVSGIYVQQIGSVHPFQLTRGETDQCPAWSPDGTFIAFSRYVNQRHEIYMVSAHGGAERKLHTGEPAHPPLSWSPDGKLIAFTAKDPGQNTYSMNLLSLETLETRKLTEPSSEHQDWAPAFSPDGKNLAFLRTNGEHTMGEIFIMPADGGEPQRLTFDNAVIPTPPAWTPDSKFIVFSSTRRSIPTLWRIPKSGGAPIQVPQVGVVALHPSISAKGNRLAYDQTIGRSSLWALDLGKIIGKNSSTEVTASGGYNWAPELSPDGQRVAFLSDRLGTMEVWTCKIDGSDLIQLSKLGGEKSASPPRWSPDGQRIAFNSTLGEYDAIFVMSAEGLFPRALTDKTSDNLLPSWSHDGKWIYFTSNRTGKWQIWKMPSQGGEPLQLTKDGGFGASESVIGDFVYYAKTSSDPDIWRIPSVGGLEGLVTPRIHLQNWKDWTLVNSGIFFRIEEPSSQRATLRFLDFAKARVKDVSKFAKPGEWISASADGKSVLYSQADNEENNIMLLENFH